MNNNLSGVTVFDYSSRLPGPLASSILMELGADVTKVELKKDPFSLVKEDIFYDWYQSINKGKVIQKTSPSNKVDIVIVPNRKVKDFVKQNINYKILIEIGSTPKRTPMHDLNALAESKSFQNIGEQSLPFIPIMGVELANKIALMATSALFKHSKDQQQSDYIVYLNEVAKVTIDKLSPKVKSSSFLHTGKFPCYKIYELKDNSKVALATVEEHLWHDFCEIFKISLHTDDRFDTTDHTFNKLNKLFKTYTKEDIKEIIEKKKLCLTII